jgi:hypothetical protein
MWQRRSSASNQIRVIKHSIVTIVIIATSGGVCSGRFQRLYLQAFPERSPVL